jgi:hypothetical protein
MIFLKGLLLLLVNVLTGCFFAWSIKAILFLPRRKKYFGGKPMPFTPGLAYRKKQWLFAKIYGWYDGFIRSAVDLNDPTSYIGRWEEEAFRKAWDGLSAIERIPGLPRGMRDGLRRMLANLVLEIVRRFLREFIPYLLDRYQVRNRIELLELKLDIDTVYDFFHRKIYRPILIVFASVSALIGFYNMIWFWILY